MSPGRGDGTRAFGSRRCCRPKASTSGYSCCPSTREVARHHHRRQRGDADLVLCASALTGPSPGRAVRASLARH